MSTSARPRGRPAVWATEQARKQASRTRCRQRKEQLEGLYHALRNAHWEEPELQRAVGVGTDEEAIAALTAYFRGRHWMHYPGRPERTVKEPQTG